MKHQLEEQLALIITAVEDLHKKVDALPEGERREFMKDNVLILGAISEVRERGVACVFGRGLELKGLYHELGERLASNGPAETRSTAASDALAALEKLLGEAEETHKDTILKKVNTTIN